MCGYPGGRGVGKVHFPTYPGKPFVMPYQRAKLLKEFWTVREAARRWGCTYRAARLYILRHPDECALVRITNARTGRVRWIMTVRAGVAKRASLTGNPDFLRPEWQRERALAYWLRKHRQIGIDTADK